MIQILRNKSILVLFLLVLLIPFSGSLNSQQRPELFIGISGLNSMQEHYIKQSNLRKVVIIYQKEVTHDGVKLDVELFTRSVMEKTSSKSTGIAIIDWEGVAFKLISGSNEVAANSIVKEFVKTIQLAKKLRPNIKWGFYGLPIRTFKGESADWKKINNRLVPIFKAVDLLAPSLYMYNADSRIYNVNAPLKESGTGDYIYVNLDYALELGKKYKKCVYPFIWQRVNSGNPNMALARIPINLFVNYHNMITSRVSNGNKIGGIIWWDSQEYYYLNRKKYPVLQREYSGVKDVELYDFNMFKKYYNATREL